MSHNLIEINGKLYDSVSGELVNSSSSTNKSFTINNDNPDSHLGEVRPEKQRKHLPHTKAQNNKRHPTEKSRTLHRKSVRKPQITKKNSIKSNGELDKLPVLTLLKPNSTSNLTLVKHQKLERQTRSPRVSHFSKASIATKGQDSGKVFDFVPRQKTLSSTPLLNKDKLPSDDQSSFSHLVEKQELDTNHRYLENPTTHRKHPLTTKKHKRLLIFGTSSLLILVIISYVVFLNRTGIEIQVADSKSGINAKLPSYNPEGYYVNQMDYKEGLVTLNYKSSLDNHTFSLTQKPSGYATDSTLANLVADNAGHFNKLENAGQTIYLSTNGGETRAVWLNNEMLYSINGNASLSSQQITAIASSI